VRHVVLGLMSNTNCWQCGSAAEHSLFCQQCRSLQPSPSDYFTFFGIERKLAPDVNSLQQRFYELSRQLHPDRYGRKPLEEQQLSVDATSVLNDACRTLRDPIQRAEYVLKQEGMEIGEQRSKHVPPELLEEVFELNEALEELRSGDESARPHLEVAYKQFLGMQEDIDAELQTLFERYDASRDRAVLEQVRAVLNRRRYVRNLIREVEKELAPAT
jgi:molecular chaperone HscB